MIKSLQSFRGIFTLVILLSHFPEDYFASHDIMLKMSDFAVSFFFILSGFVLCIAHENRKKSGLSSYTNFMFGRIKRIYPLHILGLLLWLLILLIFKIVNSPGAFGIFCNILLIQSWIPDINIYFSCNGVSWFLSTLLFCYMLFIPITNLFHRSKIYGFSGTVALICIYLIIINLIPNKIDTWGIYIFPPARVMDFLIGICTYILYTRVNFYKNSGYTYRAESGLLEGISAIVLLILFASTAITISERYTLAFWWWIPSAVLIYVFAKIEQQGRQNFILSIMKSRPLVWLGNISFSLFILHSLVIIVLIKALPKLIPGISELTQVVIIVPICIAVAWGCQRYFIKPVTSWLSNK